MPRDWTSLCPRLLISRPPKQSRQIGIIQEVLGKTELMLISDMQSGSRYEQLQQMVWPENVVVNLQMIQPKNHLNASAVLMPVAMDSESRQAEAGVPVRVTLMPDSDSRSPIRLNVGWLLADGQLDRETGQPLELSAGESQVIRMASPPDSAVGLRLNGDTQDFDNTRYFVQPQPEELTLLMVDHLSSEPRASLSYFLKRVPLGSALQRILVEELNGGGRGCRAKVGRMSSGGRRPDG